ncbi:hypothetical protein HNY73_010848 [Argiope bruennichi]|uniref:Uncharacterized protein n=1 Tax=Argiope bruennichi TaxID=94029 RepID=A0A8T0F2A6_ARGBR|nr:hypothetical protein HNY73_010848 [Argiope bruennichi]
MEKIELPKVENKMMLTGNLIKEEAENILLKKQCFVLRRRVPEDDIKMCANKITSKRRKNIITTKQKTLVNASKTQISKSRSRHNSDSIRKQIPNQRQAHATMELSQQNGRVPASQLENGFLEKRANGALLMRFPKNTTELTNDKDPTKSDIPCPMHSKRSDGKINNNANLEGSTQLVENQNIISSGKTSEVPVSKSKTGCGKPFPRSTSDTESNHCNAEGNNSSSTKITTCTLNSTPVLPNNAEPRHYTPKLSVAEVKAYCAGHTPLSSVIEPLHGTAEESRNSSIGAEKILLKKQCFVLIRRMTEDDIKMCANKITSKRRKNIRTTKQKTLVNASKTQISKRRSRHNSDSIRKQIPNQGQAHATMELSQQNGRVPASQFQNGILEKKANGAFLMRFPKNTTELINDKAPTKSHIPCPLHSKRSDGKINNNVIVEESIQHVENQNIISSGKTSEVPVRKIKTVSGKPFPRSTSDTESNHCNAEGNNSSSTKITTCTLNSTRFPE